MTRKLSLGGNDSKAQGKVGYFNPLTGGYDAPVRYTQHLDIGRRQSNWLPHGLTVRMLKAGDTEGYRRKKAAHGIPGWVWVRK